MAAVTSTTGSRKVRSPRFAPDRELGDHMFDVVVVGADDSSTARRAVEAAAEIASLSGGSLHIVSAFQLKTVGHGFVPDEIGVLDNEGKLEALLQDLAFIAKERGVEATVHRVSGAPADSLIRMAEELHADLLVVGNRGMKGARRILGSVPNSVAHGAHCSVAIIDTTD
jgi:nucleotide-binding universal stress UspA family protein